jgi:hypothetical protein
VQEVPLPLKSRASLINHLRKQHFSEGLTQWLASNLVPAPDDPNGALVWAFDGIGAAAMYGSYRRTCYWDLLASPPAGVTINVLRAGVSDRWDTGMVDRLQACVDAAKKAYSQVRIKLWRELSRASERAGSK